MAYLGRVIPLASAHMFRLPGKVMNLSHDCPRPRRLVPPGARFRAGGMMLGAVLACGVAWPAMASDDAADAAPAASVAAPPPPVLPAPDPARIFAPLAYPSPVNVYRSGGGAPGPAYWQNGADYDIKAAIDPANRLLSGSETITYVNNSPDTLDVLWLQLDQNIYRDGSRGSFANPERTTQHTDGAAIESVAVEQDGKSIPVTPVISDTRMQVPLPAPLDGKGGKIRLKIAWHYTIPGEWGGRTAVSASRNGDIYEVAQWYPRMAVYDDIRGWDTAPYLGQEFFLDYGDIDYSITVPWNFTVVGSGALLNPADVLTQTERDRLAQAAKSDERVMIRTQADVTDPKSHLAQTGTKTWHFRMNNTRDVAFAASPAFLWDAARLNLPPLAAEPGRAPVPRLAMSAYPVEGIGAHQWDRSTAYVKFAIENFSRRWYPYPWPNAVNLGGYGAGMEYPGIVFDGMHDKDAELFWITTHELGHDWFPMIVGSNERRNAFMDEGFNTFIDIYASDDFNSGEFAPKRDAEFAPATGKPADDILTVLRDPAAPRLMAPADTISEKYRHPVTYFKAAYGLKLLREQILGPERFDRAFRRYIALWAYHHPTPSDFFRLMDSEAGEDLSWFWRGWYFNNWAPDYAVKSATLTGDGPTRAVLVTVDNKGWLPLPVTLVLTYTDGSTSRLTIPTETWQLRNEVELTIPTARTPQSVTLDPGHEIPDLNRADNTLTLAPPAPAPAAPAH
ncbi:M1 family metallopeptidase [Gluconacetobacter diazotrophicus]|uniref:M1 family metallopeptidase n=2 Tax=Gluconacetobacter diazotrophicus TaxID=33996 RepID=A0A7W4I8H2_GLUDI|nr:M1 family metallopeptidase [Gluconacetobacter diazotrophicus]MBB2158164.1 M1 family metallopeptidase [Gluconacetobacter diazotrophicus]